jgi:transcriptional regulator with XRE-family HTH domain
VDFARKYNIPRMQYWRIEKGKTNLTLRILTKILLIYGLTIEQFFASLPKEPRKTIRSPKE